MLRCPESIHVRARRFSGLAGESRNVPLRCSQKPFSKQGLGCHTDVEELIHPSINPTLYLQSSPSAVFLRIHTFLYTILLCRRELPSHLTDRWSSFEVAPSHLLMWRPENEPPPQDPIKAKPRVRGFDIHRLGNLCHQHILCHVRMITAY